MATDSSQSGAPQREDSRDLEDTLATLGFKDTENEDFLRDSGEKIEQTAEWAGRVHEAFTALIRFNSAVAPLLQDQLDSYERDALQLLDKARKEYVGYAQDLFSRWADIRKETALSESDEAWIEQQAHEEAQRQLQQERETVTERLATERNKHVQDVVGALGSGSSLQTLNKLRLRNPDRSAPITRNSELFASLIEAAPRAIQQVETILVAAEVVKDEIDTAQAHADRPRSESLGRSVQAFDKITRENGRTLLTLLPREVPKAKQAWMSAKQNLAQVKQELKPFGQKLTEMAATAARDMRPHAQRFQDMAATAAKDINELVSTLQSTYATSIRPEIDTAAVRLREWAQQRAPRDGGAAVWKELSEATEAFWASSDGHTASQYLAAAKKAHVLSGLSSDHVDAHIDRLDAILLNLKSEDLGAINMGRQDLSLLLQEMRPNVSVSRTNAYRTSEAVEVLTNPKTHSNDALDQAQRQIDTVHWWLPNIVPSERSKEALPTYRGIRATLKHKATLALTRAIVNATSRERGSPRTNDLGEHQPSPLRRQSMTSPARESFNAVTTEPLAKQAQVPGHSAPPLGGISATAGATASEPPPLPKRTPLSERRDAAPPVTANK